MTQALVTVEPSRSRVTAAASTVRAIWQPRGWQNQMWTCPVSEIIVEGPRGGGKTSAPIARFASLCGLGFGAAWAGVIFRRRSIELKDIIAKSRELLPRLACPPRYNAGRFEWEWPTGEILMLRHCRVPADYWLFHGWSTPFLWLDELTTWPTLEVYDLLRSICRGVADPVPCPACKPRNVVIPGLRIGCGLCAGTGMFAMPRLMGGSTNPHGKGHNAVKRRWIDPAPSGVVMRTRETVHLPNEEGVYEEQEIVSECVRITAPFVGSVLAKADPGYQARLLARQPEHIKKAWGAGDWDITSGGMFDDLWARGVHAIQPFREIPKSWRLVRAFDWGSSSPFSYGLWALCDGTEATMADGSTRQFTSGTKIRVREYYGTSGRENEGLRMTSHAMGESIRQHEDAWGLHDRIEPGPADSSIWDPNDEGRSIRDALEAWGIRFKKANKTDGSRVLGWEQMRTMLEAALHYPPEGPCLYVVERENPHFLRLMPTMQRDDDNLDDVDTDSEDHIADETRYVVLDRGPATATQGTADFLTKRKRR